MNLCQIKVLFGSTVLRHGMANDSLDGIGQYTKALTKELTGRPDIQLLPYVFGQDPINDGTTVNLGAFQRQALRAITTSSAFRGLAAFEAQSVDLIHATDHYVPKSASCPVIATLMDVIPLSHPQWVSYRFKSLYNIAWRKSFHWADRIITISQYSKQQIIKYLGFSESLVEVVPLGVDEEWFIRPDATVMQTTSEKYRLPNHYLVCVGTLQPRKNIANLIQAYELLPARVRKKCPLIIIGRYGWGEARLLQRLRAGDNDAVRWLEYVPQQDLHAIVAMSSGFVFPSLLEGFGLPILEAFAAGIPVAASDCSSIPEVAGNAALLFDPLSVQDISRSLLDLIENADLAQELIPKGLARARAFSWERTASKTVESYRGAL